MSESVGLGKLQLTIESLNEKISRIESKLLRVTGDTPDRFDQPQAGFNASEASSTDELVEVKFQRLLSAYEVMAGRLEALAPNRWRANDILTALHDSLDVAPTLEEIGSRTSRHAETADLRELFGQSPQNRPTRDRVRIGIASMAGREAGLQQVLEILYPQADEIFVYLNGIDSVPSVLPQNDKTKYFTGPDLGDRGKFMFMEGFKGYYLTCDDDIAYAPFHVQSIIDGIEKYNRKAIVGWHGSIFKENFREFYNPKYRQVLSFRHERGRDTPVHLLGTGVCGFHTSTIEVNFDDFIYPNMADAFLAIAAKQQKVGMVVLKHKKDWATPIDVGPSISSVSLKKDVATKEGLDVASTVSTLIKDQMPWNTIDVHASYIRKPFSIAFIGRTDKDRWKKGGILKSAHLTVDLLRRFDVETILEDIETGDPKNLSGRDAEIVMLYVGDPERPDFSNVEDLVRHHAKQGRHVLVNLSFNGKETRSKFIANKIKEWRRNLGNKVWLMVFTESVLSTSALKSVQNYSVVIPKTISLPDAPCANFGESKGIFIGDIAKLSDNYLLDYPADEWIASIRAALPGVPIFAVQQYKPKYELELDIDEVWPFLKGKDFADRISQCRLMVSTVKYATFEMVPLEVSSLGVPVVYPEMPQSLSEHIGNSGYQISSPKHLRRVLPTLYYDPIVWNSLSKSGIERAWSSEIDRLSGQMYLRLVDILERDSHDV